MTEFEELIGSLQNKQLNLGKIEKLDNHTQNIIVNLFHNMMDSLKSVRTISLSGPNIEDVTKSRIIYNTLIDNDYLISKREKNLNNLIN